MPSLLHLTPIHFRVYDYIVKYKQRHDGVSPTFAEISKACDISSTSQVRHYLDSLALFGMIQCDYGKGKSRMISVPGARWLPPFYGDFSPVKQADHVTHSAGESVSGSSHKS
jgi:SOS-response transcriptional repressor LexA